MIIIGGPPPKIKSFKRGDVDRIYSEYVQVTLKAAEAEAAKSTKMDQAMGNPEKVKRKYKKRIKENQSAQSSGMSLLKPLGQLSTGTTVKIVFKYLLYYFHYNDFHSSNLIYKIY